MVFLFDRIDVSNFSLNLRIAKEILSPFEYSKFMSYRFEIDQIRFISGRLLLLKGIEYFGFHFSMLKEILFREHGKPFLPWDFDFSISHSGNFVVCGISNSSNVGVDIETKKEVDYFIYKDLFHGKDWNRLFVEENICHSFYKYWTCKESIMKADGRGLSKAFKNLYLGDFENIKLECVSYFTKEIEGFNNCVCFVASDSKFDSVELI